ncbi:serpin family protein [Prosthecobacter sp.]|uniref:serpin family protein n=1 Tax=Prosthecobacter sp. TaxID=1965333 RepID=UPI002489A7EB|nr:serpin family protein [Prosthecobacter sp.]MDI1312605.1 serpin family protein [Prosthecobacter sp.]
MRALLLALLFTATGQAQSPELPAAKTSNAHACELFQLFRHMTPGNFCFSPFSSHQMAALLTTAAQGETQAELAALAHISGDMAKEIKNVAALRTALAGTVTRGALAMEITNSLWAANSADFAPEFLESSQTQFGATLQKLPAGNATECAAAVNLWVREKTRGRISQIIGPSAFTSPDHSVIAVNTVYLKGRWSQPFELKRTKPRSFQTPTQGAVMLPTMIMPLGAFDYAEAESWQCIEMPMSGGEVSLLILLPRNETTRQNIETTLTPELWNAVRSGLSECDVNVMLPRFGYSTQLSLKGLWQRLGTQHVFAKGTADLTKGLPAGGFFVSDISHEALIEINELGAEAAAALTAAADPFGGAPAPPKRVIVNFIANRPFLWLMRHQSTGLILFMGRYAGV